MVMMSHIFQTSFSRENNNFRRERKQLEKGIQEANQFVVMNGYTHFSNRD
jgi:post-segregation antitoxin (ccd killing protein)